MSNQYTLGVRTFLKNLRVFDREAAERKRIEWGMVQHLSSMARKGKMVDGSGKEGKILIDRSNLDSYPKQRREAKGSHCKNNSFCFGTFKKAIAEKKERGRHAFVSFFSPFVS